MMPNDFKNIPFERNPNFAADASGEIIGEAKELGITGSLYDLFGVKEGQKLYYVYEGKDGKLEAYEVNKDGKFEAVEVNNEH